MAAAAGNGTPGLLEEHPVPLTAEESTPASGQSFSGEWLSGPLCELSKWLFSVPPLTDHPKPATQRCVQGALHSAAFLFTPGSTDVGGRGASVFVGFQPYPFLLEM